MAAYYELKTNKCGYKEGDIAKYIRVADGSTGSYIIYVPNRKSVSCYSPNVAFSNDELCESTEEAYNKQHGIIAGEIAPDQLIKGEYYVATDRSNKTNIWIRKHNYLESNEHQYSSDSIGIRDDHYYTNGFLPVTSYIYKKANQSQIDWLDACINKGEYVSEKDIKNPILAKKGDYVVLKHGAIDESGWPSIPNQYVYQLREDHYLNIFRIVKDTDGSLDNGWSIGKIEESYDKIVTKPATEREIEYYQLFDKPFSSTSMDYIEWLSSYHIPKSPLGPKYKPMSEQFYIKYDKDIFTKELFDKLVSKLNGMGYPSVVYTSLSGSHNGKVCWEAFSQYERVLRTQSYDHVSRELIVDNNGQGIKTEKFLKDFIDIAKALSKSDCKPIPNFEDLYVTESNNIDFRWLDGPIVEEPSKEVKLKIDNHLRASVLAPKKAQRKLITVKQLK